MLKISKRPVLITEKSGGANVTLSRCPLRTYTEAWSSVRTSNPFYNLVLSCRQPKTSLMKHTHTLVMGKDN